LRGLRAWSFDPPTIVSSFDFATLFATRLSHKKKGRGAWRPARIGISRLLQDVPKQRDAVKHFLTK
jgi:hypothetical protein